VKNLELLEMAISDYEPKKQPSYFDYKLGEELMKGKSTNLP
jgi:hypothetical protein